LIAPSVKVSAKFGYRYEQRIIPPEKQVFSPAAHEEVRVIFPPPFSPEYNLIDGFWAWLKRCRRKILPPTFC